jgi:hypothetical protein
LSVDPIYKIITDTNVYIIDLTNIDIISANINRKKIIDDNDVSLLNVFVYLKDRKDPIIISDLPMPFLMDFYTTLLKYKTDFYSFKPMTFLGG